MPEPIYRFKGRATGKDREGYYVARWDKAIPVSVLAGTRDEAAKRVYTMLGSHPDFGSKGYSGWAVRWDSIDEETPQVGPEPQEATIGGVIWVEES